jgi:hypothetical protein
MRLAFIARKVCLLASGICLAAAYMLVGYWGILLAILAMTVFWTVARKWSRFWLASSLLSVYMLLAMIGVVLKAPVLLVITGCVFALACWDLTDFAESLVGDAPLSARALMEKRRLQVLAITVGISLFLATLSIWFHLHLPFGVIVVLVLLVTGFMLYGVYHLRNSPS